MTKLRAAFRNFANAPSKIERVNSAWRLRYKRLWPTNGLSGCDAV